MTKLGKASFPATLVAAVALVVPFVPSTAVAQSTTETYREEVEFASEHPCTREVVEGDTRVRMTIETTENSDGTTDVHTTQHTHGQQLLGVISLDWYTFNNAEDVHEHQTIFGSSGTAESKTRFIHTSEDVAYQELLPGMDDYHQKLDIVFSPFLPPVVVKDTADCR